MKFVTEEKENCVGVAKGSGTWPEIAEIEKREKRGQKCPKNTK